MTRRCNAVLARRHLSGSVSRSHGNQCYPSSTGGFALLPYGSSSYQRLYSTTPSPVDKSTITPTSSTPPLPVQPKPRRLELRPGPVKPHITSGPVTVKPPPTNTDNVVVEGATKDSTVPAVSPTASSEEGVILSAKHDLEEAAQHGILAPPPPDAGRVGRLIHQAKELFVRWNHACSLGS